MRLKARIRAAEARRGPPTASQIAVDAAEFDRRLEATARRQRELGADHITADDAERASEALKACIEKVRAR